MFKLKMASLALALVGVSGLAAAATQGTLGTTSTGSYTNTFNSIARQVQILNLADSTMTPSSGNVSNIRGASPGVMDKFCVVDTTGGAVKLVMTPTNPIKNSETFVATAPDGSPLWYHPQLAQSGVPGSAVVDNLSTTGFTLPAGASVTSAGACGAGNVEKSVILWARSGLPVGTQIFTETVTIVATPV